MKDPGLSLKNLKNSNAERNISDEKFLPFISTPNNEKFQDKNFLKNHKIFTKTKKSKEQINTIPKNEMKINI